MKKQIKKHHIFYLLSLIIVGTIIVHIIEILFLPYYAPHYIWKKIESQNTAFQFVLLKPDNQIIKNKDPLFDNLICHFNTEKNPVLIRAEGEVPFWSLTIFDQQAKQIFSTNKSINKTNKIYFLIGSPLQFTQFHPKDQNTQTIKIPFQEHYGFALLRVAHFNGTWQNSVNNFIQSAQCQIISSAR